MSEEGTVIPDSEVTVEECDLPQIVYDLVDELSDDNILRYAAYHTVRRDRDNKFARQPLSVEAWVRCMAGSHSAALALDLTNLIKACPFRGLRFETKGLNAKNAEKVQFEFVLVNDEGLYGFATYADPYTFAEQFQTCSPDNPHACVFANLGGDAFLASPRNEANGDKHRYGHLAAFLRKAPVEQIQGMWKTVAETYQQQLSSSVDAPVWFSTAGGGVRWLHFRFDKRPKYYRYSPFKQEI